MATGRLHNLHVYTQLDGRSSYVEVCPILDPASTNSGDYMLPVRVETNLQLQTRNLPEPVSWREVGHDREYCVMQSVCLYTAGEWL